MEIYIVFIVILFVLAASDLVVGVSNDAVNFLNSAIGSKVGSRQSIMIVASLGILLGVLFSSGMMEVARKGIFNPAMFSFSYVMVIFLAVMLTDILLLDLFNTFGMPTSTTVSIVFELLGAAVILSIFHLISTGKEIHNLAHYINTTKAIIIICGIFLSVFVAFTIGLIAQFGSRLLFTFNYEKKIKKYGAIWVGTAFTILSFFILVKGLKGSAMLDKESIYWIQKNTVSLLLANLVFWTLACYALQKYTQINIFKVIVYAGTFSLALAFASNDLVNFIGVPIAGFQSFMMWKDSGTAADEFQMSNLAGNVPSPLLILILAGVVMIITLWKSKKAKTVTATELNLSRQHEGHERFRPNLLAKLFVRLNQSLIKKVTLILPTKLKNKIQKSYDRTNIKYKKDMPAFDLVRASVNLTIASMLIAIATSYKLPLSTTYVSFMVAMGSSLADNSWGNGSAVHRVSGVLNVIGGWLMTAIIAFSVSGLFASIIFTFEVSGLIAVVGIVATAIFFSFRFHHRKRIKISKAGKNLILED